MDCQQLAEAIRRDCTATIKHYNRSMPLSTSLIKELYEAYADNFEICRFIASYKEAPSRLLEQIAGSFDDEEIAKALAENGRTPLHVLLDLATRGSVEVAKILADSKMIHVKIADCLLHRNESEIRSVLARNAAVPMRILLELARDSELSVRSALLSQKKLDAEVFRLLLHDESPLLRSYAMLKTDFAEEELLRRADSDVAELQMAILQREHLSSEVLESLCFSPFEAIQLAAFEKRGHLHMDEMLHWLENGTLRIRCFIAGKMEMPEGLQMVVATSDIPEIRRSLASNPNIAENVALFLLHESDEEVLKGLAVNDQISDKALTAIAQLAHPKVNKILAARHDLPEEAIQVMIGQDNEHVLFHLAYHGVCPKWLSAEAEERLSRHVLPELRCWVAMTTKEYRLQVKLVYDPSVSVRNALVENPYMDLSLLESLKENLS